jgi:enoyl-CoA hydratase
MSSSPHIRLDRIGRLGKITLDRPKALNALNWEMITAIQVALDAWAKDDGVDVVILCGEGRAFCAGGDVKAVYQAVQERDRAAVAAFYGDEYRLDCCIHRYSKPIVSLIGGIVMGGGSGISILGSHRVASETTRYAMPETAIGFFPDAGGTWVLPRLPGATGRYLGLTGAQVTAADCLYLGLATHYIPSARLAEVETALAGGCRPEQAAAMVDCLLCSYDEVPGPSPIAARRQDIDRLFGRATLRDILDGLAAEPGAWAEAQRQALAAASPSSLKLTFRQLQVGASLDLERAFEVEFRLSMRVAFGHDFQEGVRAQLVDRDHAPQWAPSNIDAVEDAAIDALFRPLDDGQDLVLT